MRIRIAPHERAVVLRSRSSMVPDAALERRADACVDVIAETTLEPRGAPRRHPALAVVGTPRPPDIDGVAEHWQLALDAAQRALDAASGEVSAAWCSEHQRRLTIERQTTATLVASLALETHATVTPWLSPYPIDVRMLGLPARVRACLFDVEGVLTDSGSLHAWAWSEVFDPLLLRISERSGWAYRPFDPVGDYRNFVDGRPRFEGIHVFLASRGVQLPDGRVDDSADKDTAYGLARRKGEKLEQILERRGIKTMPGARRYLEAARRAGLACGVVSASTTTLPMLERAGLTRLVDDRADADLMHAEGLRARPAPDLLLAACRRLGVEPGDAVTLTHTPAGVVAGRTAGLHVIGVGGATQAEALHGVGAELVVAELEDLLDPRLRPHPPVKA